MALSAIGLGSRLSFKGFSAFVTPTCLLPDQTMGHSLEVFSGNAMLLTCLETLDHVWVYS